MKTKQNTANEKTNVLPIEKQSHALSTHFKDKEVSIKRNTFSFDGTVKIGRIFWMIIFFILTCSSLTRADVDLNSDFSIEFHNGGPDYEILFQAKTKTTPYSLYTAGPGEKIKQLTYDMFAVLPSVTDSGRTVFFETTYLSKQKTLYQIAKLDLSTLKTTLISGQSAIDSLPFGSPDGKSIAFCSRKLDEESGNWRIFLMDSNGNNRRALEKQWDGESQLWPIWSPDGEYIIYIHQSFAMPLKKDTGSIEMIRRTFKCYDFKSRTAKFWFPTGLSVDTPCWSPKGGQIVFVNHDTLQKTASLWMAGFDAPLTPVTLTRMTKGPKDMHPSWGPEGKKIIFKRSKGGRTAICTIDVENKEIIELFSSTEAELGHPKILPTVSGGAKIQE